MPAHHVLLLMLVAGLVAPSSGWPWQAHLGGGFGEDRGTLVTFAPNRDVVAAGETEVSGDCSRLTVARFARRGAARWETRFARDCFRPRQLFVDGAGDVVVQGLEHGDESSTTDGVLLKLTGDTGAVAWTYTLDHPPNVFEAGVTIESVDTEHVVAVLKYVDGPGSSPGDDPVLAYARVVLDAGTGVEESRTPIERPSPPAAALRFAGQGVLRKVHPDGSIAWETTIAGFDLPVTFVHALETDARGDVLLAGATRSDPASFARDFTVVKLDGADGHERWRHTLGEGPGARFGQARALALDARGNVFAAGAVALPVPDGTRTRSHFTVVRIQSRTGRSRWRTQLEAEAGGAHAIVLDRRGNVAVVGSAVPVGTDEGTAFTTAWLPGRTGRNAGAPILVSPPE